MTPPDKSAKNRDTAYDVLKGIAIILVVLFHAHAAQSLCHFGNLFHIPVFFIIAGWFFNFKYSEDFIECFRYAVKKLARLWWPMFFWGCLFVLLHNQLLNLHLTSTLGLSVDVPPSYRPPLWTSHDLVHNLLLAPFLIADFSQLAGAYWFIRTLLFSTVGYCFMSYLFGQFRVNVIAAQSALALLLIFAGQHWNIPYVFYIGGAQTLTAYALLHLGVLLRHFRLDIEQLRPRRKILVLTVAFAVLIGLMQIGSVSMALNQFNNLPFLFLSAIAGWYFLLSISTLASGKPRDTLAYIGAHTMPILLLHFIAFKIVGVFGIFIHHDPISRLAMHPVTYHGFGWCIAYTIAGISIPLLSNACYSRFRKFVSAFIRGRSTTS